ncbi:MAG: flagellar motor switch phosphatase FliY [Oscillospiraceae bacterium]|nr:flagellar motor switch phosphatase FliY [Oscillospiraceae bacterium]
MSNGLSQAEIDALLNGGAGAETEQAAAGTQGDPAGDAAPAEPAETAKSAKSAKPAKPAKSKKAAAREPETPAPAETAGTPALSSEEIDAMGEIGNISMGTSATTLSTMLNRRVDITTPEVDLTTLQEIAEQYPLPFVAVQVNYTKGLKGTSILFLDEKDVKIITDLLMGGDGSQTDVELNEMHLSAISEVMNQMVGSSATSMAKFMDRPIDISPPTAYSVHLPRDEESAPFSNITSQIVRTSFDMEIEGLIHSKIMQVMPLEFAKELVEGLIGGGAVAAVEVHAPDLETLISTTAAEAPPAPAAPPAPRAAPAAAAKPAAAARPAHTPPPAHAQPVSAQPVNVQPVNYENFDRTDMAVAGFSENMDLLMDVPLSVSVELGKSKKYIREILDFNVGSIIVLDKMAGDMVDVIVNGKLIAKGEVVVIDDSYGARVTDIVSPAKRIGGGSQ